MLKIYYKHSESFISIKIRLKVQRRRLISLLKALILILKSQFIMFFSPEIEQIYYNFHNVF